MHRALLVRAAALSKGAFPNLPSPPSISRVGRLAAGRGLLLPRALAPCSSSARDFAVHLRNAASARLCVSDCQCSAAYEGRVKEDFQARGERGTAFGILNLAAGEPSSAQRVQTHSQAFPLWQKGALFALSPAARFGGRAGGLKRRKRVADPGVVRQTGRGRRLEAFTPRRSHLVRVPYQQNARPALIYDRRLKRFVCLWSANGLLLSRPFSARERPAGRDGKRGILGFKASDKEKAAGVKAPPCTPGFGRGGGLEGARSRALLFLRQLQREKKIDSEFRLTRAVKPEVSRSGVGGVYFDSEERLWVCVWKEAGLRRFRAFSAISLGFDEAYRAAVATRRQKLAETKVFQPPRLRKRRDRQPLVG